MPRLRLVPLLRVSDAFHARVLVARLGSEGILAQMRGQIDGPYPFGDVEVLVTEDDLEAARELLLADEVEAAFPEEVDLDEIGDESSSSATPWWVLTAALVILAVLVLSSLDALG